MKIVAYFDEIPIHSVYILRTKFFGEERFYFKFKDSDSGIIESDPLISGPISPHEIARYLPYFCVFEQKTNQ